MPSRAFAESLRQHSLEVAQLEDGQAREFLRLLKQLQDELAGRIASVGDDRPLDYARYSQIDAQTRSAILTLETKLSGNWDKAAKDSVDLAIDHIGSDLDHLSKAFDTSAIDVTLDASTALADPAQLLLANHFETSVKRYGLDVLNSVRRRILIGIRTGDTVGAVSADLRSPSGSLQMLNKPAGDRLVRTEISQAYGSAAHSGIAQAAKQDKALTKVWIHVGSYLCPTCGPLHGSERPVDGTWTIKSGTKIRKIAHPPGHPRCGCRVTAMKPSWRRGLQSLGYLGEQATTGEEGTAAL